MKGGTEKLFAFPLFNTNAKSMLTEIQGDTPELTGRALVDETPPGHKGRYLGTTRHWPASGAAIKAHTWAGDPPLPQAGPRNDPTMGPL